MAKEVWTDKYNFFFPENSVFLGRAIQGSFAEELLENYLNYVSKEYKGHPLLKTLEINSEGVLTKNNLYSSVVLDKFLRKFGYRIQKLGDLEKIKTHDWSSMEKAEIDLGVIYRGVSYIDKRQAEDFAKALGKRDYVVNNAYSSFIPIFVPLAGLEVVVSDKYNKGIGLTLSDRAKPFYSKNFKKSFDGKPFYSFNSRGPVFKVNDKAYKNFIFRARGTYSLGRVSFNLGNVLETGGLFYKKSSFGKSWIFPK